MRGLSAGVIKLTARSRIKLLVNLLSRSISSMDRLSRESDRRFLQHFDFFLFDCDGVLWNGNTVLPHAVQTVDKLMHAQKKVLFVTNNCTRTRNDYCLKFARLGFPAIDSKFIFTAAATTSWFISRKFGTGASTFLVVGPKSLVEEMRVEGLEGITVDDQKNPSDWADIDRPSISGVVVGCDVNFNYYKLVLASSYLLDSSIDFVATNSETRHPTSSEHVIRLGTGALVAPLEVASGRKAFSVGKPSPTMFHHMRAEFPEMNPERCLMIGDNLTTDIKFGNDSGMKTLLVETGVHRDTDIPHVTRDCSPDFVGGSLCNLIENL